MGQIITGFGFYELDISILAMFTAGQLTLGEISPKVQSQAAIRGDGRKL